MPDVLFEVDPDPAAEMIFEGWDVDPGFENGIAEQVHSVLAGPHLERVDASFGRWAQPARGDVDDQYDGEGRAPRW